MGIVVRIGQWSCELDIAPVLVLMCSRYNGKWSFRTPYSVDREEEQICTIQWGERYLSTQGSLSGLSNDLQKPLEA